MSELRDLELLEPGFHDTVGALIVDLHSQGFDFRPSTTLRTPWQQARLWRQSRTSAEIEAQAKRFREGGAGYLAAVLLSVGPQSGPHVTNAPPGLSWHQWGTAADFYLTDEHGHVVWNDAHPGYLALAETARLLGLKSGRDFGDAPHVQANAYEPTALPLREVSAEMERRFGASEAEWLEKHA